MQDLWQVGKDLKMWTRFNKARRFYSSYCYWHWMGCLGFKFGEFETPPKTSTDRNRHSSWCFLWSQNMCASQQGEKNLDSSGSPKMFSNSNATNVCTFLVDNQDVFHTQETKATPSPACPMTNDAWHPTLRVLSNSDCSVRLTVVQSSNQYNQCWEWWVMFVE